MDSTIDSNKLSDKLSVWWK